MLQVLRLNFEKDLWKKGYRAVVGLDEVGRGPLAGPVVVGLVLIPYKNDQSRLILAQDSKVLTAKKRQELFNLITKTYPWAAGMASANTIDQKGIMGALRLAISRAWRKMKECPDFILADYGLPIENLKVPYQKLVHGDGQIFSVACASIVAKVWRDTWMSAQAKKYPAYGFEKHKGYGTRAHYEALEKYGTCPLHRVSFGLKKFSEYKK